MENILLKLEKLNEASSTPLYYQIAASLQKVIENEMKSGDKIPSEEFLAQYFKVSRPTASKAIKILINQSIVYRNRGKGTFVQDQKIQIPLIQEPISFGESLKKAGVRYTTFVLELKKIKGNNSLTKWLDLMTGSKLIYLKRIRYMNDNEPFLLINSYLPYDLFPDLLEIDFNKFSLFSILNQKYHTSVVKIERYMKVIRAFEEDAHFLKTELGDPILHMEGVASSSQGRKIEYFDTKIKADKIIFFNTLYSNRI